MSRDEDARGHRHDHLFEAWCATQAAYKCECGASLTEEVLEEHAPYGAQLYQSRIANLRELLKQMWMPSNEVFLSTDLRRAVLGELVGVLPFDLWEQAMEDLRNHEALEKKQ